MTSSININLSLSASVNFKLIGGDKSLYLKTKDILLSKIKKKDYELTNRNIRFFS